MAKVIAITSGKGGVGKTTTTVNLAWSLYNDWGYKSIIIDMDSDKPDAISWQEQGVVEGIIDFKVRTVLCKNDDNSQALVDSFKEDFDYIIIDTPPNFQSDAFKATLMADLVIIPTTPSLLDQKALIRAQEIPKMSGKPYKLLASRIQKRHNLSNQLNGFKTSITLKSSVMESPYFGIWVGEHAKDSDSHKEYMGLAKEVTTFFMEQSNEK
jgi:chromosome partitioning protein